MIFTLILALAIAILAVFFALENTMMVTVSFFGYGVDGSLALFLLIAMGAGILIGVLIMVPGRIKSGLSNVRSRRKISDLEANLEDQSARLIEAQKPRDEYPPE
jgi:putative membrane protein